MTKRLTNARVAKVLILLLAVLAFALRVYQLDAKSIWFDESHSLNRASLDLLSIASGKQIWGERIVQDTTHVPFYFFLLHFLIKLAGDSDFTLRFLSVTFGVLTIPLIYFMGLNMFIQELVILFQYLVVMTGGIVTGHM